MPAITTDDDAGSVHQDSSSSHRPNKLVRAANGIDYAYRDTGPCASGPGTSNAVPLGGTAGMILEISRAGVAIR